MTFPATRWAPAVRALAGLNLAVRGGEALAVVGPNGAGKTTLLRLCAGLLRRTSGALRIAGHDPEEAPAQVRAACALASGGGRSLSLRLTAAENLILFGRLRGLDATQAVRRAANALDEVGLAAVATRPAHVLSDGQRQRLVLARALLAATAVLLLDEPTRDLDADAAASLARVVRARAAAGAAVLVATHDRTFAAAACDRTQPLGLVS
jgi:ABC-2 type transport system ATP-binding protein